MKRKNALRLNSAKEEWLKDALQQMSIKELDDFFSYADHVLNGQSVESKRRRTNVLFHCNRIDKSFSFFCESDDHWLTMDAQRVFSYVQCFLATKESV